MFSICLLVSVQRFYPLFHWRESLRTLIYLDQYSFLVSFFLHLIRHLFHFSRNDKVFSLLSNEMNWVKQEELVSHSIMKRFCNLLKECRATNSSVKMERFILVRPIKLVFPNISVRPNKNGTSGISLANEISRIFKFGVI